MNFYVLSPIKGIVTDDVKVVSVDVFTIHSKVVPVNLNIIHLNVLAGPHRLFCIPKMDVVEADIVTTTELLRGLNGTIVNFNIIGVPNP